MKFSCEKLLLQNAVNTTSRAVAAKSSIPALEGLLLQCGDGVLTVSGYNMQTGIRTRFPVEEQEGGELVLSARLFGDIIRRMPDDMITFSSDDKLVVHLSCGDADFDILALSAADFPELPEVEEKYSVSLPEKTLRSMIQQTSFAVSTNEARPVHMGELFEIGDNGLTVVAVDGFRLALAVSRSSGSRAARSPSSHPALRSTRSRRSAKTSTLSRPSPSASATFSLKWERPS